MKMLEFNRICRNFHLLFRISQIKNQKIVFRQLRQSYPTAGATQKMKPTKKPPKTGHGSVAVLVEFT